MSRDALDRQFSRIKNEVHNLGEMVEEEMLGAMRALLDRDTASANVVLRRDLAINEKRYSIENAVLTLMATQQPIARDLRRLSAILYIITELERMGDYAKGIAKVTIRLADQPPPIPLDNLMVMAETAVDLLRRAVDAFLREDAETARCIPDGDEQVDAYYDQIHAALIAAMIANPAVIDRANLIMWAAHNIERLADRVTNLCERTIFVATGKMAEMDSIDAEG